MQTSIDKFGRVLIPKQIREHFGLHPGAILEIQESGDEIFLSRVEETPTVKSVHGILVFTGKAIGNIDESLGTIRSERLKKFEDLL